MYQILAKLSADERGITVIEYGMIVGVIGGVILGPMAIMGDSIVEAFTSGLDITGARLENMK